MLSALEQLKNKQLIWRGGEQLPLGDAFTSGYQALDDKLSGGLPSNSVIELKTENGIGELRLLMPSICAQQAQGLVVLITPPAQINAEFLQIEGLNLEQVLLLEITETKDALWCAEQSLKSGCCSTVILWHQQIEIHQARRLNLAAEKGHARLVLIRQSATSFFALPVALSMTLSPHRQGIKASIDKRRAGKTHQEFLLNMRTFWPDLTLPTYADNVVHLTQQHVVL